MSKNGANRRWMRLPRAPRLRPRLEHLLPGACLLSAVVLAISEPMTAFEFTPPGGEPLAEQAAGDRHGYGLAVIAVFAFAATLVAVFASSKPAAVSVGVAGGVALLVFLIVDLPDAGAVGTLEDAQQSFFDAEAVPQAGFWLSLAGSLGLAVSGIALATMTPEQLEALRPRRRGETAAETVEPGGNGGVPAGERDGDGAGEPGSDGRGRRSAARYQR